SGSSRAPSPKLTISPARARDVAGLQAEHTERPRSRQRRRCADTELTRRLPMPYRPSPTPFVTRADRVKVLVSAAAFSAATTLAVAKSGHAPCYLGSCGLPTGGDRISSGHRAVHRRDHQMKSQHHITRRDREHHITGATAASHHREETSMRR